MVTEQGKILEALWILGFIFFNSLGAIIHLTLFIGVILLMI